MKYDDSITTISKHIQSCRDSLCDVLHSKIHSEVQEAKKIAADASKSCDLVRYSRNIACMKKTFQELMGTSYEDVIALRREKQKLASATTSSSASSSQKNPFFVQREITNMFPKKSAAIQKFVDSQAPFTLQHVQQGFDGTCLSALLVTEPEAVADSEIF